MPGSSEADPVLVVVDQQVIDPREVEHDQAVLGRQLVPATALAERVTQLRELLGFTRAASDWPP